MKPKTKTRVLPLLFLLACICTACGPSATPIPPTETPADTPTKTPTVNPTPTPVIINATATPTITPTPTAMPGPTMRAFYPDVLAGSWDVEVDDDFSADSFWELIPGQSLVDGVLRWEVQSKEPLFAQQIPRWSSFNDDTYVRVVARYIGESESDAYGLLFHSQDENTYLAFLIRDDGTFELRNGAAQLIDHQPSNAIHPGDWNELEALWLDEGIFLYINGVQVAYLELMDPYYGQAGLAIDLGEKGIFDYSSTFEFDKLEIREP